MCPFLGRFDDLGRGWENCGEDGGCARGDAADFLNELDPVKRVEFEIANHEVDGGLGYNLGRLVGIVAAKDFDAFRPQVLCRPLQIVVVGIDE